MLKILGKISDWHFRRKLCRSLKQHVRLRLRGIGVCVNGVLDIGIPRTDEDVKLLKKLLSVYDTNVSQLNEYVETARKYIEDP